MIAKDQIEKYLKWKIEKNAKNRFSFQKKGKFWLNVTLLLTGGLITFAISLLRGFEVFDVFFLATLSVLLFTSFVWTAHCKEKEFFFEAEEDASKRTLEYYTQGSGVDILIDPSYGAFFAYVPSEREKK